MKLSSRIALVLRERRAVIEQALLNRAMRHNNNAMNRAVTRLLATQLPDTSALQPSHQTRLDRPVAADDRKIVSSDVIADEILDKHDKHPSSSPR